MHCIILTAVSAYLIFVVTVPAVLLVNFFLIFSLQNVYSKLLISSEHHRYTALELQFWASLLASVFQLPLLIYYVDIPLALKLTSNKLAVVYVFNGIFYHIQSVAAFAIMAYISPITYR